MSADTLSLAGKTAFITGSGRENGIGAAIAKAFARNGANVVIHYVSSSSKDRAEKVADSLSKAYKIKTTVVQGEVQIATSAQRMVQQAMEALDVAHIDILVNNAAAARMVSLLDVTQEQLEQDFAVNVFSVIYMTQAVVDVGKMPQNGRIINIGSIASKVLGPPPVYSATKATTDALTTLFATELGKSHGITVNTLAPGPIPTDLSAPIMHNPDGTRTARADATIAQTRAAARLGTVEDLADATLLLVSEKSRWITAQYISVSGGVTGTA